MGQLSQYIHHPHTPPFPEPLSQPYRRAAEYITLCCSPSVPAPHFLFILQMDVMDVHSKSLQSVFLPPKKSPQKNMQKKKYKKKNTKKKKKTENRTAEIAQRVAIFPHKKQAKNIFKKKAAKNPENISLFLFYFFKTIFSCVSTKRDRKETDQCDQARIGYILQNFFRIIWVQGYTNDPHPLPRIWDEGVTADDLCFLF